MKTNKTKGHQEWTIQRNWQHWVHKIQDEDKQNKNTLQKIRSDEQHGSTKNRG